MWLPKLRGTMAWTDALHIRRSAGDGWSEKIISVNLVVDKHVRVLPVPDFNTKGSAFMIEFNYA